MPALPQTFRDSPGDPAWRGWVRTVSSPARPLDHRLDSLSEGYFKPRVSSVEEMGRPGVGVWFDLFDLT
ncbi:uncharacterized protein LOC100700505 isoform X2 [Anopheles sinensis]|uniref:Uncharacterized protein LOC100700505 isoform X2 n=1 Tax=Anopheles sinensis TaxID=74873 RepID=A0A084WST3_ANOSI|nr:uncharacterized protein LOC100700505 isoform X2 [Anopheles sinensis]